jgi:hypothetical protein
MCLRKNDLYKRYVLELGDIRDIHLAKKIGIDPVEKQFWVKRESLIKEHIEDYLNSYDETRK